MRLFIFLVFLVRMRLAYPSRSLLYEGSPCRMEDGGPGICKRVTDCPFRVNEILLGRRQADSGGRCGFDFDNVEIACCPQDIRTATRIADIACQHLFDTAWNVTDDDGVTLNVANGDLAQEAEFPYVAALGYMSDGKIKYFCAGTLISESWILTAAHCVHSQKKLVPVEVRLGDVDHRYVSRDTQRIPVDRSVWYPEYSQFSLYHDVALVKLRQPVRFTKKVRPMCLPTEVTKSYIQRKNTSLIVIGWGQTDIGGENSDELYKSSDLSLIDQTVCDSMYQNVAGLKYGITERMLCAVDRNTSRRSEACLGDSGGPFLQRSETGDTIIGITSFGQGCGGSVPGIYTAVYPYLEWIEKEVWGDPEQIEALMGHSEENRTDQENDGKLPRLSLDFGPTVRDT